MATSDSFITVSVLGDANVIQSLRALGEDVQQKLVVTIRRLAIDLQGYVKGSKLSGQVLKNRTGTLRRSITQKVTERPGDIHAIVGTNVIYAAAHEYGYQGHTLATSVFGKPLRYPVWRRVNIPERSFLRSSLRDKAATIKRDIQETVAKAVRA